MAENTIEGVSAGERGLAAARGLLGFIRGCPSMFHTASAIRSRLDASGFTYLPEGSAWGMRPGEGFYTVRNNSSVIAWRAGEGAARGVRDGSAYHFQVAAAHGDSPAFKLKASPELDGAQGSLRLDVEAYGGMIDYTWFDRPLSLAGRVLVRGEGDPRGRVESRLVSLDRDVALIPSLAIHMDREVNKGFAPNRAIDLCPLISAGDLSEGAVVAALAEELGVEPGRILAHDLFLVNRQAPCVWGLADEFISSPRLDDLACAYTALEGFLAAGRPAGPTVAVYACFDNEEVGSLTKQGAASTFLRDTLVRINAGLGGGYEGYRRALAGSFMVSCDNAHAVHPNRPEKADAVNRPLLNGGIVVKEAANQRYCTDAFSRAVFLSVCERAGAPVQAFANRSDMAGGSTLGNLSNAQASMHGVDVGLPQLAMHSAYETAGARDVGAAISALTAYCAADIAIDGADAFELR